MIKDVIMVVEDDDSLRDAIVETLNSCGHSVVAYKNGVDALINLPSDSPALVISDVQMANMDGMDLMASIHQKDATMPVILITAYGSVEKAVSAIRAGAKDYLIKPFEPEVINSLVMKYIRKDATDINDRMIAIDDSMVKLSALALRVAKSEATVMITGDSGTGKEVLSRFIHNNSSRCEGPFIAINCAAIPENMLESTLFGYEKGAFTGAHKSCPGKFELAQGGTILLDEITEMELQLQAKILRVIQEREVERLGSKDTIDLDVRVIATSNRDMKKSVSEGYFREDLYYRLNVFPLRIPGLSERKADIRYLANHLVDKWSEIYGAGKKFIEEGAINILEKHSWPGNVRELDNVIQRAIILADSNEISTESIYFDTDDSSAVNSDKRKEVDEQEVDVKGHEYKLIIDVLESVSWSRKKAASKLGFSERTLRYKMSKMRESGYTILAG